MIRPFALLTQHRDTFCGDLDRAPSGAGNTLCVQRFAHALASHLYAKERCLLPVLRGIKWCGVTSEALVEHVVAKRQLAELLSQSGDTARAASAGRLRDTLGAAYTSHLLRLQALLDQHLILSDQDLLTSELADALQTRKAPAPGCEAGAQSLLDEARLVLASLGAGLQPEPPHGSGVPDPADETCP